MGALADYGIELPPGATGEVRTYCPECAERHRTRSKTLGVSVDEGVWHCFRCGWKGRLVAAPNVVHFDTAKHTREKVKETRRAGDRIREILSECRPLSESRIGQDYLRYRLQHELPTWPRLGYHPGLPYFATEDGGRRVGAFPAIIATVRDVTGRLVTLHRTYLAKDGDGKAHVSSPKKLMRPPTGTVTGCAVRLYPATNEVLHIAEGAETALAVYVAIREPVWSCISAHGLATVELPPEIRAVTIWADFDRSGAGQDAALACRKRLEREGRRVAVHFPKKLGQDWLDVLLQEDGS